MRADDLRFSAAEAVEFFEPVPSIKQKLQTLHDVGLDYIRLGQAATTLSGGEAQRVKLAKELANSHSEIRKTAKLMGQFLPGTDFVTSGYSSMPRYDNMFGGGNLDADDLDDYLVLQRDMKVDGGLRPARAALAEGGHEQRSDEDAGQDREDDQTAAPMGDRPSAHGATRAVSATGGGRHLRDGNEPRSVLQLVSTPTL